MGSATHRAEGQNFGWPHLVKHTHLAFRGAGGCGDVKHKALPLGVVVDTLTLMREIFVVQSARRNRAEDRHLRLWFKTRSSLKLKFYPNLT